MTYNIHSIVRPIGGRLALDFLNTANWTENNQVFEEKIENFADLEVWMNALDLPKAIPPKTIGEIHSFRANLRSVFFGDAPMKGVDIAHHLHSISATGFKSGDHLRCQPILGLVAVSALSLLSDTREMKRVKKCPGTECGWLFIDETKNGRRKWCIMETCGNRAKAARNYARKTQHQ